MDTSQSDAASPAGPDSARKDLHSSFSAGKGGGKGGGRGGKGKGKGKGKVTSLGGTDLATRVNTLEAALIMVMRLVCSHAQEFRRLAKEDNLVLAFPKLSTIPAILHEAKGVWASDTPEASDEDPFPLNPNGPWRFSAFLTLMACVSKHIMAGIKPVEGLEETEKKQQNTACDAIKLLTNPASVAQGVHRFWLLKGLREDAAPGEEEDKDREIWLLKFAKNAVGEKMAKSLAYLAAHDLIDKATRGGELRSDHAPKSRLQRGLESIIEGTLGNRRSRAAA